MTAKPVKNLYQYYERQQVLPTYGALADDAELGCYERQRRSLFHDKLRLPPRLFDGADVAEFGPDTGENALVFARWGARLTLIEPNPGAIPYIEDYFGRFGLGARLRGIVNAPVEGFRNGETYDLIDAEGFIYTVQPDEAWLAVFREHLRPGGLFVISYYERCGAFMELSLKAVFEAVRRSLGEAADATARRLYQTKWDTIPHTRRFESWLMDVIENPFVRLAYLYDAETLLRNATASGFSLYAAWPEYRDALAIYWHKRRLEEEERRDADIAHIRRSRLGFLLGRKAYLCAADGSAPRESGQTITRLLEMVDRQIDAPDAALAGECADLLSGLARQAAGPDVLFGDENERAAAIDLLAGMATLYRHLARGRFDDAIAHCNSDASFLSSWGMPTHFAVFARDGA